MKLLIIVAISDLRLSTLSAVLDNIVLRVVAYSSRPPSALKENVDPYTLLVRSNRELRADIDSWLMCSVLFL